ncbi:ABC transporter [Micromonospora coriariae]|uniref:ABC transporter n=1 Tax=Micromonospora coriariae TaxID=285665 RepID=A0A1C4Y8F1_9ACTN|nr:ABC transporter ATP-binding protein [Micromonospora coriariae]SCF16601.1 ABC transporter [Micromonospora coriariae]
MHKQLASAAGEDRLSGVGLHLGYHAVTVVHGAAIRFRRGAVTALVGPNGSGKSTLLRALARLHPIEAGVVHLADGGAPVSLPAVANHPR